MLQDDDTDFVSPISHSEYAGEITGIWTGIASGIAFQRNPAVPERIERVDINPEALLMDVEDGGDIARLLVFQCDPPVKFIGVTLPQNCSATNY